MTTSLLEVLTFLETVLFADVNRVASHMHSYTTRLLIFPVQYINADSI